MISAFSQIALQILPIPLGVLLMLMMKEVRLPEAKVKIRCAEEIGCADSVAHGDISDARQLAYNLPISCAENYGAGELGSIRAACALGGSGLELWRGYVGKAQDMHGAVFRRIAYDLLLTNGSWNGCARVKPMEERAFAELGLIDAERLDALGAYLRKQGRGKIESFAADKRALIARLLSFESEPGGLLMAYMMGYCLDVKVV